MSKQYGIPNFSRSESDEQRHLEEFRLRGYTILKGILSNEECQVLIEISERIYEKQVEEFGLGKIKLIEEEDIVRCPMYYDEHFVMLAANSKVMKYLDQIIRGKYILHLQNVIINRPNKEHHQTSWHRDIPYQRYTVSQPIAVNAFYCLSPFNAQTGATLLLPYSHTMEDFPSIDYAERNAIVVEADPGDVVLFNSWLFHRAGHNTSSIIRYGVNHVYTVPILRQQIDLPALFGEKYANHPLLFSLLGYEFSTPTSVIEFREKRLKKKISNK